MGVLADIFIASPVDAITYETLATDRPALVERYRPAEYRNLTGLEFGTLWAILLDETWQYEKHKLAEVRFGEGGETWLLQFPAQLVDLLANIDDDEVGRITILWSKTDELALRGGDDTEKLLMDLRRLAIESTSNSKEMYLWGSL